MDRVDISRAAGLLVSQVPPAERVQWARSLAAADGIEDVPAEWRERLLAAHKVRLAQRRTAGRT